MHTKSDNIEIIMGSEINDIIEEICESLLQKYEEGLEESMRKSEFIFYSVDLLYYQLQKISLNRNGSSYMDSTINPINNDNNCFQYALKIALNYQNIKSDPEKVSNIRLFIDPYNWKEIDFPSERGDLKKFELNNKSIALNILFVPYNTEKNKTCTQMKT